MFLKHSVHLPVFYWGCEVGGGGGVGVGGDIYQEGCSFYIKNKLKFKIFHGKKSW